MDSGWGRHKHILKGEKVLHAGRKQSFPEEVGRWMGGGLQGGTGMCPRTQLPCGQAPINLDLDPGQEFLTWADNPHRVQERSQRFVNLWERGVFIFTRLHRTLVPSVTNAEKQIVTSEVTKVSHHVTTADTLAKYRSGSAPLPNCGGD